MPVIQRKTLPEANDIKRRLFQDTEQDGGENVKGGRNDMSTRNGVLDSKNYQIISIR